jgi:hypothetical protein
VIGYIDDRIEIAATRNVNAIANIRNLQITTAQAKLSQSAFTSPFPVTDINNGDSSASLLIVTVGRISHS